MPELRLVPGCFVVREGSTAEKVAPQSLVCSLGSYTCYKNKSIGVLGFHGVLALRSPYFTRITHQGEGFTEGLVSVVVVNQACNSTGARDSTFKSLVVSYAVSMKRRPVSDGCKSSLHPSLSMKMMKLASSNCYLRRPVTW